MLAGADPNAVSANGWVLRDAAIKGSPVIALLERYGAKARPVEPYVPLHWLKEQMDRIDEPESHPRWTEMFGQPIESGDEIWRFDNEHTPQAHSLAYREGFCILRDGRPIDAVVTMRS